MATRWVWLLALGAAASGCHAAPGTWERCDTTLSDGSELAVECAHFDRPLTPARSSETISVHVRRVRDASASPRGQLWLLQGGPGGSGASLLPLAQALHTRGLGLDLYLPDHRGTGESTWLGCPDLMARGGLRTDADLPACLDELESRFGDRLDGFTATEAARDVVALIEATRRPDDALFVWGGSYGTYWGHRILQLAPDLLDGLSLDGVCAGPACRLEDSDAMMDAGAHELMRLCEADAFCGAQLVAGARAVLDGIGARLDAGHCPALGWTSLTSRRVLAVTAGRLPLLLPALVHRLDRCSDGDQAAIRFWLDTISRSSGDEHDFSLMLQNHIVLSELTNALPSADEAQARDAGRAVSSGLAPRWAALSSLWPRSPRDPLANQWAVTTRTPVLLRSGGLDPLTPPPFAEEAAQHILAPSLRWLLFPNQGHSLLLRSACIDDTFAAFLAAPDAPLDASCIDREAPLDFRLDEATARRSFGTADAWD